MTARIRHRVAVLLVWVLAFTGSAAAFGACSHGGGSSPGAASGADADAAVHAGHEGHANHPGMNEGLDTPASAACDCGCPCDGACSQGCQWPAASLAMTDSKLAATAVLPAVRHDALPHSTTHPPLRPPAALT